MVNAEFKSLFDAAFVRPQLLTQRARDLRIDLELISDLLAGPMYSLVTMGECSYVFRDPDRFPGVTDPASLEQWALDLVQDYRAVVEQFLPQDEAESADHRSLLGIAASMATMVEAARHYLESPGQPGAA